MVKKVKVKKVDKKVKKEKVVEAPKKQSVSSLYGRVLDGIEKDFSLDSSDINRYRISSGLICTDLVNGGGLCAGWSSISGQEASGKSTLTNHALKESLKLDIPIRQLRDAEGTTDGVYSANIFNVPNLTHVFGQRSKGEWTVEPKARYYDTNIMEKTFDSLIKTANRLPDKIYRKENDSWYLVLEPKDKRTLEFQNVLGNFDFKLKQKTGNLWFPVDNPHPQAFIVIDSLPALITEKLDENEEQLGGLSLNARAFSEFLPRIVGKLRRKNIVILAVNQIREKPMVMFGSPLYEPGGNALRFYSSSRSQVFARSVPQEWRSGGTSTVCVEKSLLGDGYDEYAFKHYKNTKNKFGTPYLETWTRVWIKDSEGQGRGFDPAFDTWLGLQQCGLATEERKQGKKILTLQQMPKPLADLSGKKIEWSEFKAIILSKELKIRELKDLGEKTCKKLKIDPKLDIRSRLMKLVNKSEVSYVNLKKVKDE